MKYFFAFMGLVAVAAVAFMIGRATKVDQAGSAQVPVPALQAAVPAPAPAPAPAPKVQQAAQPRQVETFPVSPMMGDSSGVREIPIPPGTKPARDASAAKGPKNAPVIFMEVSDFQCPVCKRAHEGLAALAADYPDKVRFVFKQNPLAMHKNAMNAAAASLAAGRQGRFWEFADLAFADQRALTENDLMENARKLKLDMVRFKKDYEDPALRQRAKVEGEMATALGATGTPSFFVNGKMQVGWASYGAIRQQIDNEIRAVEALKATGLSLKQARDTRVKENSTESEKFLNSPLGIEFSEL